MSAPRWAPRRSRQQNARSRGMATLEIAVRLLRVFQRIFLVHGDLDHAARHHVEQIVCGLEQVLASGDVSVERRAGGEQRSFRLQNVDIEGIDRSGRRAEAYETAGRLDAIAR